MFRLAALLACLAAPAAAVDAGRFDSGCNDRASIRNDRASIRIIDGDTIEVEGMRVRLYAIDTPEPHEPGGEQATAALRRALARPGTFWCAPLEMERRTQAGLFPRIVAICAVGTLAPAAVLVSEGLARSVPQPHLHHQKMHKAADNYPALEREAQLARRGLWACETAAPKSWQAAKRRFCPDTAGTRQ